MLIIHKFKGVREIDQKERHKGFCNGDEVHGSVTLSGPVVRPVACISLPGLSTGDFNLSLGAIMKNTLGNGVLYNFSLPIPQFYYSYFLRAS